MERAIELNGVSVARNLEAFLWGRRLAHDPEAVRRVVRPQNATVIELRRPVGRVRSESDLDELITRRVALLTAWGDAAWAERYRARIERVRRVEGERIGATGTWRLTEAVARGLAKLMAYKDEYEVARLHADPAFVASIREQFEGDWQLRFHMAPPILAKRDPQTGAPVKREFGPWMLPALRTLAKLKFLRATAFDPFGRSAERRTERALITEYEALLDELLVGLDVSNHAQAVALAKLPEQIRGYGHVKDRHLGTVRAEWSERLAAWRGQGDPVRQAPIPIRAV
jgi:indolepyruvate ferredoxin oxidoreductase